MNDSNDCLPVVFTPENEPYLGRELLYQFDLIICSLMDLNKKKVPLSYNKQLTDAQRMASQVIAQSVYCFRSGN